MKRKTYVLHFRRVLYLNHQLILQFRLLNTTQQTKHILPDIGRARILLVTSGWVDNKRVTVLCLLILVHSNASIRKKDLLIPEFHQMDEEYKPKACFFPKHALMLSYYVDRRVPGEQNM